MVLYARWITLRNCGRFLHVASDFGSSYHTHPFLSQEMLYAGLTREQTRVPRRSAAAFDDYDFYQDFRVKDLPVWFSVGVLVDRDTRELLPKSRRVADTNQFNSIRESTPTTGPRGPVPTYGSMESILPDNRFETLAVSPVKDHLLAFEPGQVFWMGKKRTMLQVTHVGAVVPGEQQSGGCLTPFVQVSPADSLRFLRMEIIAGTQRYVVVRGEVRDGDAHLFPFDGKAVGIPDFSLCRFLEQIR